MALKQEYDIFRLYTQYFSVECCFFYQNIIKNTINNVCIMTKWVKAFTGKRLVSLENWITWL